MTTNRRRKGSVILEFTLVGIPILFAWISIVEMARGMWNTHTLHYAAKYVGAYIAVHGNTCGIPPNSCTIKVKDIVAVFKSQAIGIPQDSVKLTLTAASGTTVTCNPVTVCDNNTTLWPPSTPAANPDNVMGKDFTVRADYPFHSALAMVAPGGGTVKFGVFNVIGYSRQAVAF